MIWDLMDWDAMSRRIFADVWVTMRIAYSWPRRITSRWSTSPRGKSLPLPLPRSWLGGRCADPPHRPTPHTPKGATMRKLPIILAATAALGLTLGATLPAPSAPSPAPSPAVTWEAPHSLTQALDLPTAEEAHAWEIFDHGGGAAALKVDPSRPFRVDYRGASTDYPALAGEDDAVVVGKDGRWYWFAVSYTG